MRSARCRAVGSVLLRGSRQPCCSSRRCRRCLETWRSLASRRSRVMGACSCPSGWPGRSPTKSGRPFEAGLPTTFIYVVELRRTTSFWFDRTITSATISVSVRYDNLRRHHQVSHMLDGRVEDTRLVEDEDTVRQLMTTFDHVALFSTTPLEPNGEYYVRVRAKTQPRSLWFFWPWDRIAASARANFTFLP